MAADATTPEVAPAETEQAKQHFLRGVSSYKDGDFDAALAEFEKAYEARADYRVLYNIGQVQAERHDNVAAMRALKRYLNDGGVEIDNQRRAAVEQTLQEMSQRVGSLVVTANAAGAEVLVDGVSAATLPMAEPLAVNAGVHQLTVRKDGNTAPLRRITVTGGDTVRLDFQLEPAAVREPTRAATAASPNRSRTLIAYGAAVVLGVGAGTFGLLAQRANKDLDADLAEFPGNRGRIDSDRTHLTRWAGLTDGFAAGALIAAGVGTYFLLTAPSTGETESRARAPSPQLSLLPSGAAVSLSGWF